MPESIDFVKAFSTFTRNYSTSQYTMDNDLKPLCRQRKLAVGGSKEQISTRLADYDKANLQHRFTQLWGEDLVYVNALIKDCMEVTNCTI